jgi:hypothetical protein
MYILPVLLGSGGDADNGTAHLVTFIYSYEQCEMDHHEVLSFN